MSIWFLIFTAFIAFAFMAFVRKWHDYALLFTIAIGFAVNANIFNSFATPVKCGNIIFAVDSILYTGFMFATIICAKEYGIRKAKILTSSTIAAILVSAVIEFFAKISSFGYDYSYLSSLFMYIFSVIGTFLGVWIMLFVYEKLNKKGINTYISFVICVLIASIVNSAIYYGLSALIIGEIVDFWYILLGSYIGKLFSILLGLCVYFVNTHIWIPNDLKDKYTSIFQNHKQKLDNSENKKAE